MDNCFCSNFAYPIITPNLSELVKELKENNIEFINSIPSCEFNFNNQSKNLFETSAKGNFFSRILKQILMLFNYLGDDGGLFVVIGKKL